MKRLASLLLVLTLVATILAACPAPTPQIIEVEKPVVVEKKVIETVEVVKEVAVEKLVKETVEVEVVKEVEVEKVVTATPETVTLEWWTTAGNEMTEESQSAVVEAFEASHPYIKVNMTILPESGFTDKMTTALGAGQGGPDVAFFWENNWWPEALVLNNYIEADPDFSTDIYYPGLFKTRALLGDKIIGLPNGVGANFVMYNKDVFDDAGVDYPTEDWTTDDYIDIASQLADPDQKLFGGDRPRGPYRAIFFNYGARPYSDDSTTVEGYLNSPASVASYEWLWDLVNSGSTPTPADLEVLGTEGTGPIDLFLSGRLAMATLNQSHMLIAVHEGTNFGIVPEPGVAGNPRYVHGWSLTSSVWRGTLHPQEAYEFLKFWVGPEGQQIQMEKGSYFPSIQAVLDKYAHADTDYAQAFFKVLALEHDAEWLKSHLCWGAAVDTVVEDLWDKIYYGEIEREQIAGELDTMVAPAQQALDDCVPRLGG
jgi:multiple sugar transport system substrate-binding protein